MQREPLVVSVDSQLKRQFKAAVAARGTTMTAATEDLMRLYIAGEVDAFQRDQKGEDIAPTPPSLEKEVA